MVIKPRVESIELQLLRSLDKRLTLPMKEKQYLLYLEKGFEGEVKFDKFLEGFGDMSGKWLILSDLLLENNNTMFQIDSLLISKDVVYLFEIKNYEGDYFIDDDKWFTLSGTEIKNPLLQVKRSEPLFRRILKDLGSTLPVEAHLVFINPEFTLYKTPLNLPVIFPGQLNQFFKKLAAKSDSAKLNGSYYKLAENLLSLHLEDSPYSRLPAYEYEQLEKGIVCGGCGALALFQNNRKLICSECGFTEMPDTAILNSVKEYQLLFPERRITTNDIYDWCKFLVSKKIIRRILKANYNLVGYGKSSNFVGL